MIAVPVAPWEEVEQFLGSIGAYYQNFAPAEDKDVIKIMREVKSYGGILISAI